MPLHANLRVLASMMRGTHLLCTKKAIKWCCQMEEQMLDEGVSSHLGNTAHKSGWVGGSQQPLGTSNGSLADVAGQFATCMLIRCLNEPRQIGPL